jgi:hypothetical protein
LREHKNISNMSFKIYTTSLSNQKLNMIATNFPIYCCSFCSWHLLRYATTFELAPVVQGVAATMTTFHEQGLMVRSELI